MATCVSLPSYTHTNNDVFSTLVFAKVTMLSLAIAAPVLLLNLIPSVVYARAFTRGLATGPARRQAKA